MKYNVLLADCMQISTTDKDTFYEFREQLFHISVSKQYGNEILTAIPMF